MEIINYIDWQSILIGIGVGIVFYFIFTSNRPNKTIEKDKDDNRPVKK